MRTETSTVQIIQRELEPKEKLLWLGRPKQGLQFRGSDVFLIAFGLLWGGIALFWRGVVEAIGAPSFFLWFGGIVFLFGLYFIVGRFWWDASRRKNTYYGISNERVIIVTGRFQKQVKSLNIKTLSDVSIAEKANGRGTIYLGPTSYFESRYGRRAWPGFTLGTPKLEAIEEAKRVYNILRDAQRV